MTAAPDALPSSIRSFVDEALGWRDELIGKGQPLPGERAFAEQLAALPSARKADSAAEAAADANVYLAREPDDGAAVRRAGRALTADALVATGVAGALLAGEALDADSLARELGNYLAGPAIPIWEYAIVDADVTISGPIRVVDGWELVTPTADELAQLTGLPSTARHAEPRKSFDLDLYGGLAMLRRVDPEGTPHGGLMFYLGVRPAHSLWQPLLALSLFQNQVVQLWAQYDVEPGRRVDLLFDRVYREPWTPDGIIEVEVVRRGDYEVDDTNSDRLGGFLEQLAPLFHNAVAHPERPTRATKERAARLRRVAEHFLTASEGAHGEGEVLSELNADAVLHYVIALEGVLAGGDSDKTELTRKVVQRAAVLAGRNDDERVVVADLVLAAYRARSAYAHGGEPADVNLPALRQIVRDCVLARLIVGDRASGGASIADVADRSLIDHAFLADVVRRPVAAFWRAVDERSAPVG